MMPLVAKLATGTAPDPVIVVMAIPVMIMLFFLVWHIARQVEEEEYDQS
jgi:hypothetical protein